MMARMAGKVQVISLEKACFISSVTVLQYSVEN